MQCFCSVFTFVILSSPMERRAVLFIFLGCSTNSFCAAELPNIVYILADDLGYRDLVCCNAESKIPTLRLNQFATEGMRFTDAHSRKSVCAPKRYASLTGRYAWRTRLQCNVLGHWDKPLIASDRLTVGFTSPFQTWLGRGKLDSRIRWQTRSQTALVCVNWCFLCR